MEFNRSNPSSTLKIDWYRYSLGNHRLGCPSCNRGKSDKSLGLTINQNGLGVAHCFRCNYVETYAGAKSSSNLSRAIKNVVPTQKYESLSEYGLILFSQSKPLHGMALDYLNARQCAIPPENSDLRYHSALKHPGGYIGPALIARVTDAITNQPISLHRTWIQSNGRKAHVDTPRLLLSGHRKARGVIRLWADEDVTLGLGIAEGIETALSLAHAFGPVWSLIDAGNLASFPVLAGIEGLLIGADNDAAGMQAAEQCATRWTMAGKDVRIVVPQNLCDLNDLAMDPQ